MTDIMAYKRAIYFTRLRKTQTHVKIHVNKHYVLVDLIYKTRWIDGKFSEHIENLQAQLQGLVKSSGNLHN